MDRSAQRTPVGDKNIVPIPAQLWVGNHAFLVKELKAWLVARICPDGGCMHCAQCKQIYAFQHHAVQWLYAEKRYTLDQFIPLREALSFTLDEDEKRFFIIQRADFLTTACANSLLKFLEEPPRGFYFILLVERASSVLPTITSRCAVVQLHGSLCVERPLVAFFTTNLNGSPFNFLDQIEAIQEQETVEILDDILAFWLERLKKAPKNQRALDLIALFKKYILVPPMPGSSKLFWKNLYLACSLLPKPGFLDLP